MSKLIEQLRQALVAFNVCRQQPALIGGVAVNAYNVVRSTTDIDFLVALDDADRLHDALLALGYECLYRTDDVANYSRGNERLDLVYAHRAASTELLHGAEFRDIPAGRVRVVSAEGLIGFKLQALNNNPSRVKDAEDIRELLRLNWSRLNRDEVRKYFLLFNREDWLQELIEEMRPEQSPDT